MTCLLNLETFLNTPIILAEAELIRSHDVRQVGDLETG